MDNIITAAFGSLKAVTTRPAWQYDYGQILKFSGIDLPLAYEVHFSNQNDVGTAKKQIGNENGAVIFDEYLLTGLPIYAWIYLHTGTDDGETVYKVTIPVKKRPAPSPEQATPVQQDIITSTIAALNAGVTAAERSASNAYTSETNAAGSASDAAESARAAAGSANDAAASAREAAGSASSAETYAGYAASSERNARQYKDDAAGSASEAGVYADRAEQAAAQSGYLYFYIEDGDLYMDRTPNTQVDFRLIDGDLYMEEIA